MGFDSPSVRNIHTKKQLYERQTNLAFAQHTSKDSHWTIP